MKISNNTTIYQRIKETLKHEKISVSRLAKDFDMVQTTLNKQLRGDTPLPITTFLLVISVLSDRISLEWLLTGEGSMLKSDPICIASDETLSDTSTLNLNTLKGIKEDIARLELEVSTLKKRLENG